MRRQIFRILSLLAMVLCLVGMCRAETEANLSSSSILWQPWSANAFEQAKAKKDRVFLYIKADWCHVCQVMGDITLHDNRVIHLINENYVAVRLDIDKDIDIARQYQVTSFPTMIILDSHKKIIQRFFGYFSPEDLIEKLTTS